MCLYLQPILVCADRGSHFEAVFVCLVECMLSVSSAFTHLLQASCWAATECCFTWAQLNLHYRSEATLSVRPRQVCENLHLWQWNSLLNMKSGHVCSVGRLHWVAWQVT